MLGVPEPHQAPQSVRGGALQRLPNQDPTLSRSCPSHSQEEDEAVPPAHRAAHCTHPAPSVPNLLN